MKENGMAKNERELREEIGVLNHILWAAVMTAGGTLIIDNCYIMDLRGEIITYKNKQHNCTILAAKEKGE